MCTNDVDDKTATRKTKTKFYNTPVWVERRLTAETDEVEAVAEVGAAETPTPIALSGDCGGGGRH